MKKAKNEVPASVSREWEELRSGLNVLQIYDKTLDSRPKRLRQTCGVEVKIEEFVEYLSKREVRPCLRQGWILRRIT